MMNCIDYEGVTNFFEISLDAFPGSRFNVDVSSPRLARNTKR